MIELRQQVGVKRSGKRVVFQADKAYRVDGGAAGDEYLGWCARSKDACFHPHRDMTDAEKLEVVTAVNDHRSKLELPPIVRFGGAPLSVAKLQSLVDSLRPTQQGVDDE